MFIVKMSYNRERCGQTIDRLDEPVIQVSFIEVTGRRVNYEITMNIFGANLTAIRYDRIFIRKFRQFGLICSIRELVLKVDIDIVFAVIFNFGFCDNFIFAMTVIPTPDVIHIIVAAFRVINFTAMFRCGQLVIFNGYALTVITVSEYAATFYEAGVRMALACRYIQSISCKVTTIGKEGAVIRRE